MASPVPRRAPAPRPGAAPPARSREEAAGVFLAVNASQPVPPERA